jgi:hypothetical protein
MSAKFQTTVTHEARLTVTTCITCGTVYAMDATLYFNQKQRGGYHYCPNGHSQGWDERNCQDAIDKVEAQLAAEQDNVMYWQNRTNELDRQLTAQKGQTTKLRKRIANGVCPCCHRSFVNVQRHMKSQHPDFVKD